MIFRAALNKHHKERGKIKRGQAAFEAIIILAVMLFILLVVILSQQETLDVVKGSIKYNRIRANLNSIAETATAVYYQGEGAKTQLLISIPPGVASGVVNDNSLIYVLGNSEAVTKNLGFDVVGSLPVSEGNHWINIESKGGYVVIHLALFTISPNYIIDSMNQFQNSSHTIKITNIFNESLNFNLAVDGSLLPMELSDYSFSLNPNQSHNLTVTLFSNISYGKYFEYISINGTAQVANKTQHANVLVSLDVVQVGYYDTNGSIQGNIGFIPDVWDYGRAIPNIEYSKMFILFSGLNVSRDVMLSFNSTESDWLSFTSFSSGRTGTMVLTLSPGDYQQLYVYLKPGINATEGNYSGALVGTFTEGRAEADLLFERPHDIGPPIVNNTNVSATAVPIGDTVCVSAEAYDDVGVMYVRLIYTDNNGINHTVEMNDTNISCALNASDNVYGAYLMIENPGNYTIAEVYASDYELQIGRENPNLTVTGLHAIYGNFPFNGTIREEPDDSCTYGGDTWPGSVAAYIGDGSYVDSHDDGNRCSSSSGSCCGSAPNFYCCSHTSCDCWAPDYVEFLFPDLGVPDVPITNVELVITHRDDLTAQGQLNTKIEAHNWRHMIMCHNGDEWVDIEPYELSLNATVWINYTNIDISTCVKDASVANSMRIRMTYDPFDDTGSMIYIDYIRALVDTSSAYYPDLWDMGADLPIPVDFTSGLNSTANTFGLEGASDEVTESVLLNSNFDGPSLSEWTTYGTVDTASGGSTILFSEDFESSSWDSDWIVSTGGGVIVRDSDQYAGAYSLGFSEFGGGEGYIYKSLDLAAYNNAVLRFYYAMEDLENGDEGWVDIYSGSWTTEVVQIGPDDNGRHATSPSDYIMQEIDLTPFSLTDDFRIRFRSAAEHSEQWDKMLIDDVSVTTADLFGFTDYWYVDSNNNPGSPSNPAGLQQSFTSPASNPISAELKLRHSTSGLFFGGEAWAYCNISDGLTNDNVWQEYWNSDIHNGNPILEEIDVTSYITSNTTVYTLNCGAIVTDSGGRTIVAFDDISLEITYISSTPETLRNDGWDWADGIYGASSALSEDFVTHYDPSSLSDGSSSDRVEIIIGGANSGTDLVIASGAWGVEFNITPEMYQVISQAQATAFLSFTFYVEDLYETTDGLGMGGAWIKGRFGNTDSMNYIGTTLDNIGGGRLHYADSTPEVWAAVDIDDPGWGSEAFGTGMVYRSYAEDISQYITRSGRYYLELGGKASWQGGSKADDEGLGVYFDNVRILIKY